MDNKKHLEVSDIIIKLQQIDWEIILRVLSPIISCYVAKKGIKTYILNKEYKPKDIRSVVLPPELIPKYSDIDEEKILAQKFGETVLRFAKFMVDKFPPENLINFYNNINKLIVSQKSDFKRKEIMGQYNIGENKIEISDESSIYHELFHMSSTILKGGVICTGFNQEIFKPKRISLGEGINEGYTQLLTKRYFENIAFKDSYSYLVIVASTLERVVGQEKMEKLYLNTDLFGLINELKSYASEEEIMNFIAATDFFRNHFYNEKKLNDAKDMIVKSLKTISNFLVRISAKKINGQFIEGKITLKVFSEELALCISALGHSITIGKRKYEYLSNKTIEEILMDVFSKTNFSFEDIETTPNHGK